MVSCQAYHRVETCSNFVIGGTHKYRSQYVDPYSHNFKPNFQDSKIRQVLPSVWYVSMIRDKVKY